MDVFETDDDAYRFLEAGGTFGVEDWFKFSARDRLRVRAAAGALANAQALRVSQALQGKLTEGQRQENDQKLLENEVLKVANRGR